MAKMILALVAALMITESAWAAGGEPKPEPTGTPGLSAESRYNAGLVLTRRGDWKGAEQKYREAIRLKSDFPEAWNELGHALKNQERYDESIKAYEEALRLRPNYAQALEYLGEAYVKMGKLDKAREVLARLQPLDQHQAAALDRAISGGSSGW
ncbi:MAG TPA: tetratricopeptide repeat protein [Candidatus Kryptonia bacterium]|nr:tetratricopeptide repeat protein [Candidatus Kryptonia bacterium]